MVEEEIKNRVNEINKIIIMMMITIILYKCKSGQINTVIFLNMYDSLLGR